MTRRLLFVLGLLASVTLLPTGSSMGSSCLECHGDESILKSLFVPPDLGGGEGEG